MPIRAVNKLNNANTVMAIFGGAASQFKPPVSGPASCWMNRALTIIEATQAVDTALTGAQTRTLTFYDGSLAVGSALVLSLGQSVRGTINASLPAETLATIAVSNVAEQVNAGSPPTEESRIAFFYLDDADNTLTWFGTGSATQNQGISGTPEYIGIDMNLSNATQSNTIAVVPTAGTFKLANGRYIGASDSTYEIALMVGASANVLGSVGPETIGALFSFATEVHVDEGDEITFRLVRTAGTGTNLVIYLAIAFVPDSA